MTLKQIILRFFFPLTIILFGAITKWWHVLPVDAPDSIVVGFPFVFVADGWFTSMSFQFFAIEFAADFLIYFSFCLFIAFLLKRYLTDIRISKALTFTTWIVATITIVFWLVIFSVSENQIKIKRNWDMQVIKTGFKFTWTHIDITQLSKK
jgi:hypothetical protein